MLGAALALCCSRENKIRHFNAAAKDSLCHLLSGELNIFPPATFCIPRETQNSDWELFLSLLITQEQLGADWQGGLEVSLITASQVWDLLVCRDRMQPCCALL